MCASVIQTFYVACYYLELPFIERYKAHEEPWPWNEDKDAWNKLWWRSIKLVAFNVLVVNPMAAAPFYFLEVPVELDF